MLHLPIIVHAVAVRIIVWINGQNGSFGIFKGTVGGFEGDTIGAGLADRRHPCKNAAAVCLIGESSTDRQGHGRKGGNGSIRIGCFHQKGNLMFFHPCAVRDKSHHRRLGHIARVIISDRVRSRGIDIEQIDIIIPAVSRIRFAGFGQPGVGRLDLFAVRACRRFELLSAVLRIGQFYINKSRSRCRQERIELLCAG